MFLHRAIIYIKLSRGSLYWTIIFIAWYCSFMHIGLSFCNKLQYLAISGKILVWYGGLKWTRIITPWPRRKENLSWYALYNAQFEKDWKVNRLGGGLELYYIIIINFIGSWPSLQQSNGHIFSYSYPLMILCYDKLVCRFLLQSLLLAVYIHHKGLHAWLTRGLVTDQF